MNDSRSPRRRLIPFTTAAGRAAAAGHGEVVPSPFVLGVSRLGDGARIDLRPPGPATAGDVEAAQIRADAAMASRRK